MGAFVGGNFVSLSSVQNVRASASAVSLSSSGAIYQSANLLAPIISLKSPDRIAPAAARSGGAGGVGLPGDPEYDRGSADLDSMPPSTNQQQGSPASHGGRSNLGVVSIQPVQLVSAQHAAAHSSAADALWFAAGKCLIDVGLWYASPLDSPLLLHVIAESKEDKRDD